MKKTINYITGFLIVAMVSCVIAMFAIAYDKQSGQLSLLQFEVESVTDSVEDNISVIADLQQEIESKDLIIEELNAENIYYLEFFELYEGVMERLRVSLWNYAIIPDIPEQIYTSNAIIPMIYNINIGNMYYYESVDYEIEYANNIDIGVATATIYGIGVFSDLPSKVVEFTIIGS